MLLCRGLRSLTLISSRRILSAAFSLEKDWAGRHAALNRLGLGGDYEWIGAVQKKFIGGGLASAVDVDAAVCVAEHKDQVDDVLELIYKLRHTENAAEIAPSTEYALIRLLLKHDPNIIFTLVDDPINYGIFMNEHSACLAIDYFLKQDNVQGAARLAAWTMQQEMTDCQLLNVLGLYSCAKWAELPIAEQTMPKTEKEVEEEINDDDIRTFKFPYLKNPHFDSHFDLEESSALAGKSLMWLARDTTLLSEQMRNSLRLLGAVLYDRLDIADGLVGPSIDASVAEIVCSRLTPAEGAELDEQKQQIVDKLAQCQKKEGDTSSISSQLLTLLEKVRESEESKLMGIQKEEYNAWNERREQLVRSQAERVLLKVRSEELAAELRDLETQREKLNFFENRLRWEKKALENNQIIEETAKA